MKEDERAGLCLNRQDPFSGMVKIPAGTFRMGEPEDVPPPYTDAPAHDVTISKDFWMGRYPVTERFYAEVMGEKWDPEAAELAHGVPAPWGGEKFLEKLNDIFSGRLPEGYRFDLPTEAQWEYAAKAGSRGRLPKLRDENGPAGKNIPPEEERLEQYRVSVTGHSRKPVWQYPVNVWGLYGIPGGCWEYCRDLYDDYPSCAVTDPEGPGGRTGKNGGKFLVVRGADCVVRQDEWFLRVQFVSFRLVIAPRAREKKKTEWELRQERQNRQAKVFFEEVFPGKDVGPLILHNLDEAEFAEYMEFARRIKREHFSFEKAKDCIIDGLDMESSTVLSFCRDMADEAANRWDREHDPEK